MYTATPKVSKKPRRVPTAVESLGMLVMLLFVNLCIGIPVFLASLIAVPVINLFIFAYRKSKKMIPRDIKVWYQSQPKPR